MAQRKLFCRKEMEKGHGVQDGNVNGEDLTDNRNAF